MGFAAPIASIRRVLRHASLRRVLVSYLAFHIAEFSTWVAILLYAYERTGPASVGIVALIQLIPGALVAAPVAALGDRYPRERVLTAGYLVQAVALLATAVAMAVVAHVAIVYGLAAIAAGSLVITRPTQSALLPALASTPDDLTAANGAAGVVEGIGVLSGPLLAAVILSGSTEAAVFVAGGVACLVAALCTMRLRPVGGLAALPGLADDDGGEDAADDRSMVAGLRVIARDPDARLVVGLLTARMLVVGMADVLFVLLALELLGTGEPGAALLNAALGVGAMVGGIAAIAIVGRGGLAWYAGAGALGWGLSVIAIGLTATPVLAPLLLVVGGAGLTVVDVAGRTILQRSVEDRVLSRVFGVQEGLAMAALAVGSVAISLAASIGGLGGALVIGAVTLPVVVLAAGPRLLALDRRARPPVRALALLRRSHLFRPLPGPQLEAVARHATWEVVPGDTVVIRQGDPGDRYYVLAEGGVRVEQDGVLRRELVHAGDGFGEIALLRDVPRTATVRTTRETILLTIDRSPFLAAVTGHPDAYRAAHDTASDRALGDVRPEAVR